MTCDLLNTLMELYGNKRESLKTSVQLNSMLLNKNIALIKCLSVNMLTATVEILDFPITAREK